MKVRLLKDARIKHRAGEVVDIASQLDLDFLISTGSAELLRTAAPAAPEDHEQRETRTATAAKKTARKK